MTLVTAAVFALACAAAMSGAIWLFSVVAFIPYAGLVTLSGNEVEQPLRLVELLATVLIAVWWIRRRLGPREPLIQTRFDRPLILLVFVSCISLVSGYFWLDPNVPAENVRLAVSIGQILLLIWPIGIYFVVANTIRDDVWVRRIQTGIVALALPTLAFPFPSSQYVWSVPFALAASPWCFAKAIDTRWGRSTPLLIGIAVSPIVAGFVASKAYWYIAGSVGLLIVALLRARVLGVVLAPLLLGVCLMASYVGTGDPLPPPVRALVTSEVADQSIGGAGGRERLAADAVRIWSGYPLLGVGPGNVWPYMHTYSTLDTPHNQFLNLLLELGLAGLACFLAFVVAAFRTGLVLLRRLQDPSRRRFVAGWVGMFAGVIAGGITGDVLLPSIRNGGLETFALTYPQWVVLGLVVSLAHIERRDREGRTMDRRPAAR